MPYDTRPGGSRLLCPDGSITRLLTRTVPERHAEVPVSQHLADFIAEFAYAKPDAWILRADGVYDLHPDVHFVPQDVPPGD